MLCEDCKKNTATVVITVTAGGEVTTRHLCQDCMKKMEHSFTQGDVQSFLSSLLSLMSSAPKAPQLTCSGCGLHYREFQQTGKLGCAQCYQDFAEELRPLLQRIHGRNQHAGRIPGWYTPTPRAAEMEGTSAPSQPSSEELPSTQSISPVDIQARTRALRQQMDEAVSTEDFEQAARLRDEIRALQQETGDIHE